MPEEPYPSPHADRAGVGLPQREADRRLAEYGRNEVGRRRRTPVWSRVLAQLRDPLILVLLGALVLTLAIGDHPDAVVIGFVVVVNTSVGVTQEVRADRAVEALSAMSAPIARVLRDGVERQVAAMEVVPGDVVLLSEGDIIPADASLLESSALLVDESAVTGESVPVEKGTGGESDSVLRAGTIAVHGRAVGVVTATGAASTLGQIAALLDTKTGTTPLQRRLAGLGRILALVTIALCLVVLILGLARGQSLEVMAVTAVSLAVAAVPESLPAVVTLSLALGARRMAARHAIVRRLSAVETLGSVTMLATDKTGTLTEGSMVVEEVWTPRGAATLTGIGYAPLGEVRLRSGAEEPLAREAVRDLFVAAALCNDATLSAPEEPDGAWTALGDPTEAALLTAAGKAGIDHERLVRERPRIGEVPFDSTRRRMTTVCRTPGGDVQVCLKGAPEAVLTPGVLAEPAKLLEDARQEAARLANDGYRVLAIARTTRAQAPADPQTAESGLALLGLVAMSDPPKQSAADTLAACRRAGITTVLITGDHPATAAAVAGRLGLLTGTHPSDVGSHGHVAGRACVAGKAEAPDQQVVTGGQLAAGEIADLTRVRVFARTSPQQKLEIVQAWRSQGRVTAMTGDGVNDGPALRHADIGVAMGHRGTEVARQAADLVLADDDVATIVSAVKEGRRIYDNIRRFLLFGMSGGTAEIAVMLLGPPMGLALPLRAGQILWINLLTHGLTGVAMGAEPASPGAMNRPPRPPQQHVLGDGLWNRVLIFGALITAVSLGAGLWAEHRGGTSWQSILFLTLLTAQLGLCLGLRERLLTWENPWLPAAVTTSVTLGVAALYVPALRTLLDTEPLSGWELLPALLAAVLGLAAGREGRQRRQGGTLRET
ncbi:cation-translocating P-type ATPase [Actinacidiphila cocklensis]|uniref:Ca2+-transporting ATPase n=1 Tax=Actinacidiphila cocklensis TaxID=887465 RepID=A0A9W4GT22_9ACTN|nr:cation-transporting P-type ATPase [Actinacidiphila cocklensis]WSX72771.1 cation-transporting P-type ATPase [Streptomyces sp. NBC_00899]WSX81161.1 cation-transporting P-type ATPase [Streptomyces sp. NBC_00899]CAG6395856.1 Ca2+-transporting ATPase [Actinacidiphila cocklensis]